MLKDRLVAPLSVTILLFALVGIDAAAGEGGENGIRNSLVKIYNIETTPDYDLPWNMLSPEQVIGSGSIIDGRLILTNAHIVSDSSYLEVKPYGSPQTYAAEIVAVSHEADLAVVTVEDDDFWEGRAPLSIGGLPQVLEEVIVYGFPDGGESLSLTQGVVSRIELSTYVHSKISMLQVQIDAAVNPGNSGGPAIIDGAVAGVISQGYDDLQNVNYMVPPPVIEHFLADVKDGQYDGFPDLGIGSQNLENKSLRALYSLPSDNRGILVVKVFAESPAMGKIHPLDVIAAVDGQEIASDGTVELRPGERVSYKHFVRLKQVGDKVKVDLIRKGKPHSVTFKLTRSWGYDALTPYMQYDRDPSYFVYGGIVFTPLTENFLATWGEDWIEHAPSHLLTLNFALKTEDCEQAIIASKVLPHELNRGFEGFENKRITHLNGKKLLNLQDLVRRVDAEDESNFLVFTDKDGKQMVIDKEWAKASREDIHDIYGVGDDRSSDLQGSGGMPWLDGSCQTDRR